MNQSTIKAESFDVFLCHNWDDKPEIRGIARTLEEHGIKPWLDEDQIRPGTSWQTALGEQIEHIKTAAVFVGESGLGPWQSQEIQALLSQFVKRNCPVIPVVLPSAKAAPDLPWTLQNLHWVDFRVSHPDPLNQLVWGITGDKPGDSPKETPPSVTAIRKEVTELFPTQKKKVIEIRLPGNLADFSAEEQSKLLRSLCSIMEIGDVKLTRAVAGSVRLYLELDPEDADKLHTAGKDGFLANLGIQEVRLYPALPVPPEDEQRSQLNILLDRVTEYWIDGVLKNSLYHEVLISLGKRAMDEAVQPPSNHYAEFTQQRRFLNLKDSNINTVFDATGLLLILGEPGSGKTTTMLGLGSDLIERAKEDPKERIPIVLNLSNWKEQRSIDEWIAEELSAKYRIPRKIGRSWLKNNYILPLLDGLDEVKTVRQPDCVTAINKYIDKFEPSGLVVCCRLMEYQWLPVRLKLNGAICLELLGSGDVDDFLNSGGKQLAGLRQAMKTDLVLQELSQTPLMLSIMSLAFEGVGGDDLARQRAGTTKQRRDRIFELYIDRMFQRKELIQQPFSKNKVVRWLAWLARRMKAHSQSVFIMEELQPNWLNTNGQRAVFGIITAFILSIFSGLSFMPYFLIDGGLIVGLSVGLGIGLSNLIGIGIGCWSGSFLKRALIGGLLGGLTCGILGGLTGGLNMGPIMFTGAMAIVGLIVGLTGSVGVGSLMVIGPVETLRWEWNLFFRKTTRGIVIGSCFGIGYGLIRWFGDKSIQEMQMGYVLVSFLVLGIIFGIFGAIISGLLGVLNDKVKADKIMPNQGISLSLMNAIKSFSLVIIFSAFSFGLIYGLFGSFIGSFIKWVSGGLVYGLILGLIFGVIVGQNRGGSAVIKHYSLRLILWGNGYTPFNFVNFLDHCAKLILLKKVGGGYMFIHRMLLEHFAEMDERGEQGQETTG